MKDATDLPLTPDFDHWPVANAARVAVEGGALAVTWEDGRTSRYHALFLAENDPGPEALHPLSRETLLTPMDLPEGLAVLSADILPSGAVSVGWSHDRGESQFHPGWLFAHGWFGDDAGTSSQVRWTAEELVAPLSFDGPEALADPRVFRDWLVALRDYGVARLRGLPDDDANLLDIVARIGVVRETNFGRTYTLAIKDDPDSNAFTPLPLPPHIDLPTRECPPGLQFLYVRDNSTKGGKGLYVDSYRVAEDIRADDPALFETLCTVEWRYNNRAKTTSYIASGPIVQLDGTGQIAAVRYNPWLRAPFVGPLAEQDRAYRAYRAFAERTIDPKYQMQVIYKPGDLFAFDNRRALHGRTGYDAASGSRFIEGVYSDRDELHSAIRVLDRRIATGEI